MKLFKWTSQTRHTRRNNMWDMITNMATDRVWIYTGIAGSLFGAAFVFWFKDTSAGLWCYAKFASMLNYFVERWGWTWLAPNPDAWRTKYPHITIKIDELETRLQKMEKKK